MGRKEWKWKGREREKEGVRKEEEREGTREAPQVQGGKVEETEKTHCLNATLSERVSTPRFIQMIINLNKSNHSNISTVFKCEDGLAYLYNYVFDRT